MYNTNNIKQLHLELTTKCNAACPQCARRFFGGPINPQIPLVELTLNNIRTILPLNFLHHINKITICGLCGDPCMASEALEIVSYLQTANNKMEISIYTNGSLRPLSWWKELACILLKPSCVVFGIDGIGEVNQVYRRKTNWNIIIRNVNAFIKNGGRAFWDFIVFEHNEHQINDCEQLSKQLGFAGINFVNTERFVNYGTFMSINSTPVHNQAGKQIGSLQPPKESRRRNSVGVFLESAARDFGNIINYFDTVEINCTALEQSELLVTAEGFVVPCCWFGHFFYMGYNQRTLTYLGDDYSIYENDRNMMLAYNGQEKGNAKIHSIEEVLENEFFSRVLEESWKKCKISSGKPVVCSLMCGSLKGK